MHQGARGSKRVTKGSKREMFVHLAHTGHLHLVHESGGLPSAALSLYSGSVSSHAVDYWDDEEERRRRFRSEVDRGRGEVGGEA